MTNHGPSSFVVNDSDQQHNRPDQHTTGLMEADVLWRRQDAPIRQFHTFRSHPKISSKGLSSTFWGGSICPMIKHLYVVLFDELDRHFSWSEAAVIVVDCLG
jgi:hypothetical protein